STPVPQSPESSVPPWASGSSPSPWLCGSPAVHLHPGLLSHRLCDITLPPPWLLLQSAPPISRLLLLQAPPWFIPLSSPPWLFPPSPSDNFCLIAAPSLHPHLDPFRREVASSRRGRTVTVIDFCFLLSLFPCLISVDLVS
ncbi:hypothetical protein M9458_043657, partial [Cirrhinus mrigala]